uniref:Gag polyprotein n=1 Tax=Feline immunodeficiency virus TaxID=11673 RepID=A0A059UI94_9RETR|nr:gag protein [Feline immunodeficiency virus]
MGNESGKEERVIAKRCTNVVTGSGGKSPKYAIGNIRWAMRFALVATGRDPQVSPTSVEDLRELIADLSEKEDKFGGSKELTCAIKTLKVLVIAGCLNMKCANTDSAIHLFKILGLESRPSKREGSEKEEPAQVAPIVAGPMGATYTAFNPRTVAIWMEKAREGIHSEEAILWFTAFSTDLTPTDMAQLLMSAPGCAADKELIDQKLKELTKEYERTHPSDGPRPLPYPTAAEIMGIGIPQEQQAMAHFEPARRQCREWYLIALNELRKIRAGAPRAVSVKQGPKEPYSEFVDRLFKQIEAESAPQDVKQYLKDSLSISNANPECKRAMSHLRPEDKLEDKIRACQDIGSTAYKMNMLAQALHQVRVQQVQVKPKGNPIQGKRRGPLKCFNCGKIGHMAKVCRAPKRCNKCGKTGHISTDCFQMFSGNGKQGGAATPQRNQMQVQQSVLPTAPPLEEAPLLQL